MSKRFFSALALVAMAAMSLPAHAATVDPTCTIAGGSVDTPHFIDQSGDGFLSGIDPSVDPTTTSVDPTDILNVWFSRDAGGVHFNVQLREILPAETNIGLYGLWDYAGSDPAKMTRRYVSAQIGPELGVASATQFDYGFLDPTTPGFPTYTSQGATTGHVTPGSPGIVSIDVPLDKMGNPSSGTVLGTVGANSTLLIGAAGTGLVATTDDSATADDGCFDGVTV